MKKTLSIIVLILGVATLAFGVVFLVLNLNKEPAISDGEFLILASDWTLSDNTNCASNSEENLEATNCIPSVYWKFTEAGKGTLTTNNHINNYDFEWEIKDGELIMRTNWLYPIDNKYQYTLDQENLTLTLKSEGEETVFTGTSFDNH